MTLIQQYYLSDSIYKLCMAKNNEAIKRIPILFPVLQTNKLLIPLIIRHCSTYVGNVTFKRLPSSWIFFYLHVTDACTLHLFQSDPTPHFPFLRRSLLASLQYPYRFFQGEILKPRPTHTPPATDWPPRFGSHVLDACLQTLKRSHGTGDHLMRIAGLCRSVS